MRFKWICGLLFSAVVAWLLSGCIVSYLNPVYVRIQAKGKLPQELVLISSKDGQFRHTSRQSIYVNKSNEWKDVRIRVAAHQAGHLRLEFQYPKTGTFFREIQLNGHPLNLLDAYQYQARDIFLCEPKEDEEISCISGGNQGYITFPPQQLARVIPTIPLWKKLLCFALCFMVCLWVYKQYAHRLFFILQKKYPAWLLVLLFSLLVYLYYMMRIYAFLPRLEAIFFNVSWTDLLFLFQEQVWAPALLLACGWGAFVVKNRYCKGLLLFVGCVVLLLESIDCALLYLFNARFSPEQISVFGPDIFATAGPFIKSYLSAAAGIYNILLIIIWGGVGVSSWRYVLPVTLKKVILVFAVMGFVWYLMPSALTPSEKLQLRDWPRLSLRRVYAPKNNGLVAADFTLTYSCQEGLNSQQNIIIILMESLSSYMSDYFSAGQSENWTPQLDKLARQYAAFTNYRTTNPDTTQALFSILTGFPAIHYYAETNLYREPKFYHRAFPSVFHQAGYYTAFFTSAMFAYGKDDILQRVNLDEISTHTDPFYTGKKRFVFDAVSDDVLYARAEKWIEEYTQKRPYLLLLETTTSHGPFIDPVSGEESLEKTIRYADKALGDFIAALTSKNLLHNTLVVITSDHRVTLPLDEQQTRIFGQSAEARVPLVIIGSLLEGKQTQPATHIDLGPSLEYLTLPQACFHPYQHNIFSPETIRKSCTLFQSFITKDTVDVECQNQFAQLCLTQDNDFICQGKLETDTTKHLLSFTNWIRDNNRY